MAAKLNTLIVLSAIVALSCVAGMPEQTSRVDTSRFHVEPPTDMQRQLWEVSPESKNEDPLSARLVGDETFVSSGTIRLKRQSICNGAICTNFGSGTNNIGR